MSDNSIGQGEVKSDEKLMALFSHLSLFFGGIILPIIFWATNKDKSKFVTFHALQSLWFHIAYVVLIIVISMIVLFGGVGLSLIMGGAKNNEMPVLMIIAIVAFYILLFAFIFGGMGYSIYMGIKSFKGEYVKYPVIGKMVYNKVYSNA